jgi:membrane associated rhomboid family serine protease
MQGILTPIIFLTFAVSWWVMQSPARKEKWLLRPYLVMHDGEWYRVLSHAFIHADMTHLLLNLFVLWQFGGTVEQTVQNNQFQGIFTIPSDWIFPVIYFGGVLAASIPSLLKHQNNPGYASLGASGAVSAVLMAYILLYPTSKLLLFFVIPMPAFVAGILFFAYERTMNKKGGTGIAHDAHLYGALWGVGCVLLLDSSTVSRLISACQILF